MGEREEWRQGGREEGRGIKKGGSKYKAVHTDSCSCVAISSFPFPRSNSFIFGACQATRSPTAVNPSLLPSSLPSSLPPYLYIAEPLDPCSHVSFLLLRVFLKSFRANWVACTKQTLEQAPGVEWKEKDRERGREGGEKGEWNTKIKDTHERTLTLERTSQPMHDAYSRGETGRGYL